MRERNLYKRSGIYWLRATIDGIERRESLDTRDLATARKARNARIEKIKGAVKRGEASVAWGKAVEAWSKHTKDQIAPSTAKRYGVSLLQCSPWLNNKPVAAIDGRLIADMIDSRQNAGASPATIRRDLTAISRVLEYCEARNWREGNPTLSKRRILNERRDPIFLPEEESIAMILEGSSPPFSAFIVAARLTGCRQNELVTVPWRGFNARAQTLEVIGKGNKRRVLELSSVAANHIAAHPRTLKSDLIFCRSDGDAFLQAASDFGHIRREVEKKAKRDGLTFRRFRFHDLRHLFAVEALRGGMSIYRLQKHLGHSSVKTTEMYLEFLTPAEAERAMKGDEEGRHKTRHSPDLQGQPNTD